MYFLRWLTSKSVRRAAQINDHVLKILNHQRDELPVPAVAAVEGAISETRRVLHSTSNRPDIETQVKALTDTAEKWLQAYPHPTAREYTDMFLVAGALALAIRTFFLQPMVIPTGSAQPTFFGITHEDLRHRPDFKIPGFPQRMYERWVKGISYYEVVATSDGEVQLSAIPREPTRIMPLVRKVEIPVKGSKPYPIWFPPEDILRHLDFYDEVTGKPKLERIKKGDYLVRSRVTAGDHLFVNRITYNFRQPRRGDTIVFQSLHHPGMTPETHYIKRLVALGGERVRIGDDRHVYINGKALDATTPGFEHVYSFDPKQPPRSDQYSGHANGQVARQANPFGPAPPNFPDETTERTVRPGHYMTFGDNTMNSADSRYWPEPDFPQERVVGKSFFVFWPITDRFGWGQQ